MAADPKQTAEEAYVTYVKEKGFAPKNASQLLNFCKLHDPPFLAVKYSIAKDVVSNPPSHQGPPPPPQQNDREDAQPQSEPAKQAQPALKSETEAKTAAVAPAAVNPYLDASVAQNFVKPNEHQKFIEKHDVQRTKSKIANAYDLFKQETGAKPANAIQFLSFCEKNKLTFSYSECSQYMQYMKKHAKNDEQEDDEEDTVQGAGYSNYSV
mmetsp:Transcript_26176/g.41510  ORF Transcript_26176/g.41510 Transcript_26176/m.41510 type:complete len:210 (+) Transcript_26176:57-686(+)